MASAKALFKRQYGLEKWTNYDEAIRRLRCPKDEEYRQLLPSDDVVYDTPIFACKFAQHKNNETFLALANEDGKLAVHDTSWRHARYGVRAHNNAIFDLAWMFANMKIVTASGDHTAKLFDVSNADVREIQTFLGHSRSVKTIAFRKDDPCVFASGGRDGNIILWDTRTQANHFIGKFDRLISNSHNIITTPSRSGRRSSSTVASAKSVTGLVFQNDNTLISCGAGDGAIKIWDLRKNYVFCKHEPLPKTKLPYGGITTKNGFSSLIIDKDCIKLYANCLDNTIYCYNVASYNPDPIMKYTGHQNSTFYIKSCLSRDGLYLISGSSDENAYIWNINNTKPVVRLSGHVAEVTCVAWCERDDVTVVTCSDDMSHKVWRTGPEDLPDNWEIIGKGKAETIPLVRIKQSERKRPLEQTGISKKQIKSCMQCDSPSTSTFCQNCSNPIKRRPSDELSSEPKKPRRLFPTEKEPLPLNFPNFVLDGVAPHLSYSPPKRKGSDWLTQMRTERALKRAFGEASTSPKVAKLEVPRKCSSPQSSLLRFFKVKSEGHGACSGKSASTVIPNNNPQSSQ